MQPCFLNMFSLEYSKDIKETRRDCKHRPYRSGIPYPVLMRARSSHTTQMDPWLTCFIIGMFYYHLGSGHGIVLGQKQLQLEYSTLHNIFYIKNDEQTTILHDETEFYVMIRSSVSLCENRLDRRATRTISRGLLRNVVYLG
jgi:hypothetical protein